MKKLVLTDIVENVRRLPARKSVLQHIINSYEEALAMLVKALGASASVRIVDGGAVVIDGSEYTVSNGTAVYNGELFEIPAHVVEIVDSAVWVIDTSYSLDDPVQFTDLNLFSVHSTRKLKLQNGLPGSGVADFNAGTQYLDFDLTQFLKLAGGTMTGALNMGGHSILNASSIQETIWQPLVVDTGWVSHPNYPAQYRKELNGRVHFRGKLRTNGSPTDKIIDYEGVNALPPSISPPQKVGSPFLSFYEFNTFGYPTDTFTPKMVQIQFTRRDSDGLGGISVQNFNVLQWNDPVNDILVLDGLSYDTTPY